MHAHFHFPEGNSSSKRGQPRGSAGRRRSSSESSISIETTVSGLNLKGEQLVPDYPHWRHPGMSEWDINQNTPEVKFETPEPSRVLKLLHAMINHEYPSKKMLSF